MSDVLISGGGVAGSTLAILLGRRGLQVELFERGHFPREKPCGEGLMPAGVAVLNRLVWARQRAAPRFTACVTASEIMPPREDFRRHWAFPFLAAANDGSI